MRSTLPMKSAGQRGINPRELADLANRSAFFWPDVNALAAALHPRSEPRDRRFRETSSALSAEAIAGGRPNKEFRGAACGLEPVFS
jgi:hypothetical protein